MQEKRKLWLISQDVNNGYDTYDSAVVAAYTEEEARHIHPGGGASSFWDSWAHPKDVKVQFLGDNCPDHYNDIICTSFNAG